MREDWTDSLKLAYFAGLVDGDGSIGMYKHGKNKAPFLILGMTDESIVRKFAEYFGVSYKKCLAPSRQLSHLKTRYEVHTSYRKAAAIIEKIHPYLLFKKEVAETCLTYYKERPAFAGRPEDKL